MTQRLDIEQVFQLKGHHIKHFHISTPVVTGVDMDDQLVPEPFIMLSASAEEH